MMMSDSTNSASTIQPTVPSLRPRASDGLLLVLACAAVLGFVAYAVNLHEIGFPLDDSWIHQTYARNLAEHGEWSFVQGKPSAASTAPFYSALLALGHWLDISVYVWTHLLGILALFMAAFLGSRLAERLFPATKWVGLGTGLLIIGTWHLIWAAASGMETMLFMALSLAVIWYAWNELASVEAEQVQVTMRRGAVFGSVSGLLFMTRPEGIVLVGLAGLLILLCRVHANFRLFLTWGIGVALGFLLIVSPYMVFNYSETGGFLPATASAKIAENAPFREHFILERYLNLLIPLVAGAQLVWLPAIGIGIWQVSKRLTKRTAIFLLPLLWAFSHLLIFALRLPAPYQHGRYVMPIVPPLLLFAVGGMLWLVEVAKDTPVKRVLARTLALSAVGAIFAFYFMGSRAYAQDVRIINTEMVKTAKWLVDNPHLVPPSDVLAVHDIGAVGYYAPRDIFDLAGLISPEVVPIILDHEALMQMMCKKGIRWLMVLPDQQPATDDDPRLELLYSTEEPHVAKAGGAGNMKVFRLNFAAGCSTP